jgi:pilus assembly protein CpaC
VAPSVSEITGTTFIPTGFTDAVFPVPNLSTRKLETTVHLKDGQTLALAGLLQDNLRETTSKIPGLGDLPILGSLFRSSGYQQQKTDLLVAVTPHLVNPAPEGTLQFPGDNLKVPNQYEFYLQGRLEGAPAAGDPPAPGRHAFQQASAAPGSGGLEGVLGFQSTTN